ncbi:MAG TPA: hypothetical protein PLF16_02995 [Candidatus Staskawiczbacteria bacterium]|nr:hypothetical protein [Candidatus Staskawiczbacteria bacterium]
MVRKNGSFQTLLTWDRRTQRKQNKLFLTRFERQGKDKSTMITAVKDGEAAIRDLPNRCLGKTTSGAQCSVRLPRGSHVCPACQSRINKGSRFDNAMPSDGNHRRGNLLTGQADFSND